MKRWKKLLATVACLAIAIPAYLGVPAYAADSSIDLSISGLSGDKATFGKSLTFKATGGHGDSYSLVIDVDGNQTGRAMNGGAVTLNAGTEMLTKYTTAELPVGRNYTVYAKDSDGHVSAAKTFKMSYESPSNYKLVATPVAKIEANTEQYVLSCPPVLYKDGKLYKKATDFGPNDMVQRYEVYKDGALVSQNGMVKGKGYYTVNVYMLFVADGKIYEVAAAPVTTGIVSGDIQVKPGDLEGTNPAPKDDVDKGGTGSTVPPVVKPGIPPVVNPGTPSIAPLAPSTTGKEINLSGTKISSVKNAKGKAMQVKWNKNANASGYQIQYSTDKSFKNSKKVSAAKNTGSKKIKSLKKGKTYQVRIRTYKTVSGSKYYSGWSSAKKVKVTK